MVYNSTCLILIFHNSSTVSLFSPPLGAFVEDGRARREILTQGGDCEESYAVFWTFNISRQKYLSLLLVFACKIETTTREYNMKFVIHLVLSSSRFQFLLAGVRLRRQKAYKHSWKYRFFHHGSWNMCWFLILGWFK